MDVPIHALLGKQVNERTPVAWWDIDLPPEDVAAEVKSAAAAGYTAFKTKGRPWFDIWEQAKQGNAAAPKGFRSRLITTIPCSTPNAASQSSRQWSNIPSARWWKPPFRREISPAINASGGNQICGGHALRQSLAGRRHPPARVRRFCRRRRRHQGHDCRPHCRHGRHALLAGSSAAQSPAHGRGNSAPSLAMPPGRP